MVRKVLHGLKNETYKKKIHWFLSLTPTQRYSRMLEISSLAKSNYKRIKLNDRRPFKTIQILKQI